MPSTLTLSRLGSLLVAAACASAGGPQESGAPSPTEWPGCYVVRHLGAARHQIDSLSVVLDPPAIDSQRAGFRRAFHYEGDRGIEFGNQLFIGPAWRLRADTLVIAEGVLSGWRMDVVRQRTGFAGWYSTFSDSPSDAYREDSVAGTRVRCPTERAT